MMGQARGWVGALLVGMLALVGGECRAAMTLQFNITPGGLPPDTGSLTQPDGTGLMATNLYVSSVSSVDTGKTVALTKYFDFQTTGTTGANFFVLDDEIEKAAGSSPDTFSSIVGSPNLTQLGSGSFMFTMKINYGFVSQSVSSQFGTAQELGWTGLLTLNISKFDNSLGSTQVTMGTLVLTSVDPVPAGETLNPSAVPEPASVLMAGMGLLIVARYRFRANRRAA